MFFPVTIYNADGKVKKVLSSKALQKRHWKRFREEEQHSSVNKGRKPEKPKDLKKKLDLEFPVLRINHG